MTTSHTHRNIDAESSPLIHPPTTRQSLLKIIKASWVNVLLVFIPLGFLAHFLKWGDTTVFTLNFFAIIPLAKLLGFATEDIALRTGQVFKKKEKEIYLLLRLLP